MELAAENVNMHKVTKKLFGRLFLGAVAILTQVIWIVLAVILLGNKYPFISLAIQVVSAVAVLWLTSMDINPAYKLAWTILILALPVAGAVIYILFGKSRLGKDMILRLDEMERRSAPFLKERGRVRDMIETEDREASLQSAYIRDYAGFPLHCRTRTEYFRNGEELFQVMKRELRKAEHYIFLEYFIIDDGVMWQEILSILEEKARIGVDVRLIYDDMGCVNTLPKNFQFQLQRMGIKCQVFNPFLPIISVIMNNRDHRKIMVIDGHTSFTGGINLADEYINKKKRFGYWKDTGIMLKGEATWNFTVMFLQMWDTLANTESDYKKYRPYIWAQEKFADDGFVQPYSDVPLDRETVGENVYLNLINRARRYIYIFTPYLITDNEMVTALKLAAKSGVDVRIVLPGIPDKKMIFLVTRSYYRSLIEAGVKIYEYNPGFLHAKSFVCDDEIATVGTINMDFRSLYLHFECGIWMYRSSAVQQIREDAEKLFSESTRITTEFCDSQNMVVRTTQLLLRLFAPLL